MELTIIQRRIFEIRGHRVMLDSHLAELYGVSTGNLNKAVKRNIRRFPLDFMFQLNKKEFKNLIFQSGISSWGGARKLPYAFTAHGVAMLSSVLRSKKAVEINISIMRAFIMLRQLAIGQKEILKKIHELEKKYNKNFEEIYAVLDQLIDPPQPKRKKVDYKHYDE